MNQVLYAELQKIAKHRDIKSYEEVAPLVGLDMVSLAERQAALAGLAAGPEIVAVTDAVLQGCELPEVDYAVHYDLPWSPLVLEQRRGRVDRIGRKRPLHYESSMMNLARKSSRDSSGSSLSLDLLAC